MLDKIPLIVAQQGPGSLGEMLISVAPFLLIFVIFYFLLLAPARKRQKELQLVIDNLKKGDRVLTSGGLLGEVHAVEGSVLVLKIADNVKVRVLKSAVSGLEGGAEKTEEKS